MNFVEYLIVGDGYAGTFFAHQLIKNKKKFKLFSEGKKSASHISAGVCNPVVLKRFNKIWKAEEELDYLHQIFQEMEEYLGKNYLISSPVVRVFHDEEEKKSWLKKSEQPELKPYLNQNILHLKTVENPYGAASVNHSLRLNVAEYFHDFINYLKRTESLEEECFDYHRLNLAEKKYKNIHFDKIIFAEGVAVNQNPFFNFVPVRPNKGHRLSVELSHPSEDFIIKKRFFLFPTSPNEYFYGATYDRENSQLTVETSKVEELKSSLQEIYSEDFRVKDVFVGFRATTPDRRPILGAHSQYSFLYILNGLGSRGALNGSFFSKTLFDFIENQQELSPEIDVKRYFKHV